MFWLGVQAMWLRQRFTGGSEGMDDTMLLPEAFLLYPYVLFSILMFFAFPNDQSFSCSHKNGWSFLLQFSHWILTDSYFLKSKNFHWLKHFQHFSINYIMITSGHSLEMFSIFETWCNNLQTTANLSNNLCFSLDQHYFTTVTS